MATLRTVGVPVTEDEEYIESLGDVGTLIRDLRARVAALESIVCDPDLAETVEGPR